MTKTLVDTAELETEFELDITTLTILALQQEGLRQTNTVRTGIDPKNMENISTGRLHYAQDSLDERRKLIMSNTLTRQRRAESNAARHVPQS